MNVDFDAAMAEADAVIWETMGELVKVNGNPPVRVIWEDKLNEFDVMAGAVPELSFLSSGGIVPRKGDKIERVQTGGIFEVTAGPYRLNGMIVVRL